MIIAVSGTLGSGKDTVAEILASYGFEHLSTADILRAETSKLDRPIDRETLRITGNELRKKYGSSYLVELALKQKKQENIVVSGVRSQGEVDAVKKQKNAFLLFVDAPIEIRYKRISNRKRNLEDQANLDQFKESEILEATGDANSQNLAYCKEKADQIIQNKGSLEELKQKVKEILRNLNHTIS